MYVINNFKEHNMIFAKIQNYKDTNFVKNDQKYVKIQITILNILFFLSAMIFLSSFDDLKIMQF